MNQSAHQYPNLTIEHMKESEVQTAIVWAQNEGWNPGIHDAQCFYQADPNGFYAAKLAGEIVGTVSVVKYSEDFAFEGLLIVNPAYRGMGVGSTIQRFVAGIYGNLNLGLDGVLSMQEKYAREGFRFAHKNTRYAGIINDASSLNRCAPIHKADFAEVAAFDAEFFPALRNNFLNCWLFQSDATALLVREKESGTISGYGVIRKCVVGYKIGPLFAADLNVAHALFCELSAMAKGKTVFLDVPEPNAAAVQLAKSYRMEPVFSTVRMYTKKAPSLPLNKIYGVTSFELG
jgi:GNAT superfamily N-acetyltransferase